MLNRSRSRFRIRSAASLAVMGLIACPTHATTLYWDSNDTAPGAGATPVGTWGGNAFWNDQSNGGGGGTIGGWQPGSAAVFSAGSDAIGSYTVTVSATQLIAGLTIEEGSPAFTGGTIDLGASGASIDAASGTNVTISSILAGGRLTKTGAGTIALGTIINQSNTFTGGVTITGGVVRFQGEASSTGNTNNALGVIPTTVVPDHIRLDNGGVLSSTRISTGGSVLVATNRGIQLGSAGGTIDLTDATANNSLFYAGVISGTGSLTKTGPGTLQFQGVNTYQGDTYVAAGGLGVNGTATFGSGAGTLHLNGGAIVAFATRTDANRIANPIAISADTVLRNTNTQTTGQRILPFNSAPSASGGTLTIRNVGSGSSNFTVRLHADGFNFARPVILDHGAGVNTVAALECINDNPSGVQTFSGQISGNGTLIRSALTPGNGGTTVLLSANTYTGGTQINRGFIALGDDSAAGAGTITFGGAGTGDDPSVGLSAIGADRTLANAIVFNLTSHVTIRPGQTLTFAGPVDLGNATRQLTINNPSLAINNSIGGNAGLTKDGTGTLILNAASTYPGPTTITDGKLVLGPSYSSTSPIELQNTGSLELLPGGLTVLRMNAVTLGPSGTIDLQDNKLITTDSVATVAALIASGRSGSTWTGTGLITTQSAAQNSNYTTLAVARGDEVRPESTTETALWAGQIITGSDTLVMYTYGGDATLDGKINIDDYIKIDNGIANALSGWSNGDFNYDGKINIDDYTTVIDQNIANQNGIFPTSIDAMERVASVPEPAAAMLMLPALLRARRRRRMDRRR